MKKRAAFMAAVVALSTAFGGFNVSALATPEDYGTRTVTDCSGLTSTFTSPPTRVATITTSVLEFLLAMDLQDSIIGTQAVRPGAFEPEMQELADSLPKLGGEYVPGAFVPVQREELLSAEPDLVLGGWPSNFDTSLGALSQSELTERGIPSYYALAANCERTAPVTDFSVVYQDIENYGRIFDVEDRSDALVSEMKGTVTSVQDAVGGAEKPGVYVYNWDDGQGTAYAAGNQNTSNAVVTQAGGKNIFDDVDAVYQDVSWEDVVARNPDVIVIEVFGRPTQEEFDKTVAEAESFFTSNPALQNVSAVKNRAFVPIVAETSYMGSPRNADAVLYLAKALHPDAFKD